MPTSGANTPIVAQRIFLELLAFARTGSGSTASGGIARVEHRDLPVEADRGARDERHARGHARAVDRVARREVVGAVEHDVGIGGESGEFAGADAARGARTISGSGLIAARALRGSLDLRRADVGQCVAGSGAAGW